MKTTSKETSNNNLPKKIWEVVPNPGGRPRLFKTPKQLWEKAKEYFKWIDDNPWQDKNASNSLTNNGGENNNSMRQNVTVIQRAYTLYGFCAFAGIASKWADFKRNYEGKEGFLEVIYTIENIICSQQVDGAIINKFNSNLVSRLNNITDTTKIDIGGEMSLPKLSEDDIERLIELNGKRRN